MEQVPMNIGEQINNVTNTVKDAVTNTVNNVQNAISNVTESFSSPTSVEGSPSFLQSNGLVAKFAFLILVLIVFFFIVHLGVNIIGFFMRPNNSPYIVSGMVTGNSNIVISQDPRNSESIIVPRSNNQNAGVEFTWSTWLLLTGTNSSEKYQHIFSKGGNGSFTDEGIMAVNNAPGLYVESGKNTLLFLMDVLSPTSDSDQIQPQTVKIENIPLNKWFHICIRVQNTLMDIYVNGVIDSRIQLTYLPKQNYDNIFIGQNSGFQGFLSNLRYYDYACNITEINQIISKGPDTNTSKLSSITKNTGYNYLSYLWYS